MYTSSNKDFAFYYPDDCELHNGMCIHCTVIEVKTNPTHAKELVDKAYKVLNEPIPKHSDNCEYYKWIEETLHI